MKTNRFYLIISILLIILAFSVTAIAQILIPASEKAIKNSKAPENTDIIERVTSENGEQLVLTPPGLEKRIFIHYAKPDPACGDGVCDPGEKKTCPDDCQVFEESNCYDFLGRGVKWTSQISYIINPTNSGLSDEEFVTNAISLGAEEWDKNTGIELFIDYDIDYFATWDSVTPDGINEFVFGDYETEGVIAVTVVWGYFSGPPQIREISEFDILFDTDYTWGDADNDSEVMDLWNIAIHELGHGIGLGDLYETACSEETMYGYSTEGETIKRNLNSGDIAGLQELYGE